MTIKNLNGFEYVLANPTGNITALVVSKVDNITRQFVVREIFKKEPTCEQVGFIEPISRREIKLEMMGGEFCGNAALCAAAYLAEQNALVAPNANDSRGSLVGPAEYLVYSSGIAAPVQILITKQPATIDAIQTSSYVGTLNMPIPQIKYLDSNDTTDLQVLANSDIKKFPLVQLEGIYHMLIPSNLIDVTQAESIIKKIASQFDVPAFGLVLYNETQTSNSEISIKPLVYVKESDTLIWENGCASGSIAAGYFKYIENTTHTTGEANSVTYVSPKIDVFQPGGTITITVRDAQLLLQGTIKF